MTLSAPKKCTTQKTKSKVAAIFGRGKHSKVWVSLLATSCLTVGCSMNTAEISKQSLSNKLWSKPKASVNDQPDLEHRIDKLVSNMTLEQKVAQMIQPEIRDFTVEDMRQYGFGSYLNGGGSFPNQDKNASLDDWVSLAEQMHQASIDASKDGIAIPTMWGTDAVHGHTNVKGAVIYPHNIGLGAARNPDLIEKIAAATANEVAATGIDWVFAPTVAVARDDRWGRTYESYSEDPKIVADYARAFVHGMQGKPGDNFFAAGKTISTLKHFIGDGATHLGDDQGDAKIDEMHLWQIHGQGYFTGIEAGAQTVMASFNSWQGDKVHGHRYLLTDVLKGKLGFDGLVVGDWNGHGQVPGCTNEHCPQAINAGVDILMAPGKSWKALYANTIDDVKQGVVPQSRIDDAVRRILRVKARAGILNGLSPQKRASGLVELFAQFEHRALARQAVRESLVLLKNNDNILPLNPQQRILIAGNSAHDIGRQSGGWTITWQGTGNTNDDFPNAESVYQGLKQQVDAAGGQIELSVDGSYSKKPDVAVVVFGEKPYAEGNGDLDNLEFERGNKQSLALLNKLKQQGIPVVSVFISGRPMWVNPEINRSDAFVAAWLPGGEGGGIADILLRTADGKVQFDFKGRLPFSWPSDPNQGPLNAPYQNQQPLFELGYGLNYQSGQHLDPLSELASKQADRPKRQTLFNRVVAEPFKLSLKNAAEAVEQSSSSVAIDGLDFRTIDWKVQEDAFDVTWSGSQRAGLVIGSPFPEDFRRFNLAELVLEFDLKVVRSDEEPLVLAANCQGICQHGHDLSKQLSSDAAQQWQHLAIPFRCLLADSAGLEQIYSPFEIWSEGQWRLQLANIRLRQGSEPAEFEQCTAMSAN